MRSRNFNCFLKACLTAVVIVALVPVVPAQAQEINPVGVFFGFFATLFISSVVQFVVFPASILVIPIFKGRRADFFFLYLIFVSVYFLLQIYFLPIHLYLLPIIPGIALAVFYWAAWAIRKKDSATVQHDEFNEPLER